MHRATCALLALALAASVVVAADPPESWQTVAERTGFDATSSYEQTVSYLERLAAASPEISLGFFGTSPQGRPMPLVIAARDGAFTPEAAAATKRAVVLVQNGVHSGEIDGKDASLMILRDLAAGARSDLLDGLILLFVPIYNVDGHERTSPYNRPNQNGPLAGMGFRTTADGHDLNRDHLKLVTPEARAMIGLFNRWRPHLHIDNHVTDGVEHDWVLTYSWAEAPQVHPALHEWAEKTLPPVVEAMQRAGHRVGPYAGLVNRSNPAMGIDSWVGSPRYSSGYYPLRHRLSILVENHSYAPYRDRVLANRDFLLSLFENLAAEPASLVSAVRRAEDATVAAGRPAAAPSEIAVRFEAAPATEMIFFPVHDWLLEESDVMGVPILRYFKTESTGMQVPWVHVPQVALALPRPRGYLVQPGWPVIEARLAAHDLRVQTLDYPVTMAVETMRLSDPERVETPGVSYQGLSRIRVSVERQEETRRFPAGTLWIPADQPDFEVAVQLFEPEAADSLVRWGLLSSVLERKEYIEPRILEGLAADLLKDPAIARDWEQALEDESLSGDPAARFLWWYRRTPYWDETIGLMPVVRVMQAPGLKTSPWSGPVNRTD